MNNEVKKKYVDLFIDNEYKSIELYSLEQFERFCRSFRKVFYDVDGVYISKGGSSYIVFSLIPSRRFCLLVCR